jgi:ubiquinone/menaquinone biosynthesis C-methylase UbiE
MNESKDLVGAEYETYSKTAEKYDRTRAAFGLEIIHGCLTSVCKQINELDVIDAGCGTGNYAEALTDLVGTMYCFDASPEMLAKTKEKLAKYHNVRFEVGNIIEFPSPSSSADAILINQVLHHLDKPSDSEKYDCTKLVLKRVWEVLRPGGVFILNTSTRTQMTYGFLWADLIPEAVAQICPRFPPITMIRENLNSLGFSNIRAYIPVDETLQQNDYLNLKGPLLEHWRNGDSTWSLATEKELDIAFERINRMTHDGTMHTYIEQREALRRDTGQSTFIVANKPKDN